MDEYMKLEKMAMALDKAADRLGARADSLKMGDVIRLFAKNAFTAVMGDLKRVVISEATGDMQVFANPRLVTNFIQHGSLNVNSVIETVISGDVERLLKGKKLPRRLDRKDLKRRVANAMRKKIKERSDYIQENWSKELNKTLDTIVDEASAGIGKVLSEAPEDPTNTSEGTGCGDAEERPNKKPPAPVVIPPATGKVPRNGTFALTLANDPDSYGSGDSLKIESYEMTLKIGADGMVSGKYSVNYNIGGYFASAGTSYSEVGTWVQKPGTPPVSNWPINLRYSEIDTNYTRTLLSGPQAGQTASGTRNDFYGSIRSLGQENGAISLGPSGLLAVWETAEFSQSARMR